MIEELDVVALKQALPDVPAGTHGAVLLVFDDAYEIEFVGIEGTFAVPADQVTLIEKISNA